MIKPMLAMSMDKVTIGDWNDWAVEQKFDGWRVVVEVSSFDVVGWTRPRRRANGDKTMEMLQLPDVAPGQFPAHLKSAMQSMPNGTYDGELLGGRTSTDVGRRDLQSSLRFVVFDILRHGKVEVMTSPYSGRRALLEDIFRQFGVWGPNHPDTPKRCLPSVVLAESIHVTSAEDVKRVFDHVRAEKGEGVMLKRKASLYQPGKRSRDLVKVKALHTAVCTVVGFEATRGKIMKRGPFATVVLEDANGNRTSVKTKDDAELEAFNRQWRDCVGANVPGLHRAEPPYDPALGQHPSIGRKLRIEFQDFTPDQGYRHPRWDRWEEE